MLKRAVVVPILLALIVTLAGCGSSIDIRYDAKKKNKNGVTQKYYPVLDCKHFSVVDYGVSTSAKFKYLIMREALKFTAALPHVDKIWLVDRGQGWVGLYKGHKKEISLAIHGQAVDEILQTLYHELGHAMARGLSPKQIYDLDRIYQKRLRDYRHDRAARGVGMSGRDRPIFPSWYARSSKWEFLSEHIMYMVWRPLKHAHLFPVMHDWIEKRWPKTYEKITGLKSKYIKKTKKKAA